MPSGATKKEKKSSAEPTENENALKHLYGKALLTRMAKSLEKASPGLSAKRIANLFPQLEKLEMKPRVRAIRDELRSLLPQDYLKALKVILRSANDGSLRSFDVWPYTEFVQAYGLKNPNESLDALSELTQVFTSEWAVRPFLRESEKSTLAYLLTCTKSKNESVRRWASEGSRPRLPWGERLHSFVKNPAATAKILDALKFDDALFVRKSVANHLNDIAKDHPDYVVKVLNAWQKQARPEDKAKIDWIVRHSLRTLIKAGNKGALKLIGVDSEASVDLKKFSIKTPKARLGNYVEFEFEIESTSKKSQKLVIDYVVHFVKSNGKTAPKVFKLKTLSLGPKESVSVAKAHPVKKITTRTYYAGKHALELQINGQIVGRRDWVLEL